MASRLKINLIFLIMAVLLVSAFLPIHASALDKDGLSVSKTEAGRGETVMVYVNIPALPNNADSLWIKVYYDPSVFELPVDWYSWGSIDTFRPNLKSETGTGVDGLGSYFSFAASSNTLSIPTISGKTLTAKLNVKNTAAYGSTPLKLVTHEIAYTNDNGVTYTEMWNSPSVVETAVVITPPSYACKTGGGITVNKTPLVANEVFYVYVDIPVMDIDAVVTDIEVEYDPSAFTFLGWETYDFIGNERDASHFGVSTNRSLDNVTLRAKMQVKPGAAVKDYTFTLNKYSLCYYEGTTRIEMWDPIKKTANATVKDVSNYPVAGYGISAYPVRVKTGETFEVYVNIPPLNDNVVNMDITVTYNSSYFDLVSWSPRVGTANAGSGYFGVSATNSNIDMRNGMTFTARMRAIGTVKDTYTFTLYRNQLSNNYVANMWNPTTTQAYVTIYDTEITNQPYNPSVTVSTSYRTDPAVTAVSTRGSSITVSSADTTRPADNNNYDDDDDEKVQPDDDDTTLPVEKDINITLDSELTKIDDDVIILSTQKRFFSGDTIVILRNTEHADECAQKALKNLDLTGQNYYAFDISVYDVGSGQYIHSLPSGYIDLTIPIPDSIAGSNPKIGVYHTEDGSPEFINSTVSVQNGQNMVTFRAVSFSPYMFVDLSGNRGNSNTPNNQTNNYVRPANPHTGVIIAITLPAALIGCVIIAKKGKKRKRSTKNRSIK